MISSLDHIVLLVRDIEAGVAGYQALFGRAPAWRAHSEGVATAIFSFANTSLELVAPDGRGEGADRVRSALDAQGEGLASLAFAVNDITKAHHRLKRLGLSPSDISDGESRDLASGRTIKWKRTRTATEMTGGVRMFFIQRNEPLALSPETAAPSVVSLDHLVIATPNPDRVAALYGARLDLDMKLDRTIGALGTRFLFFRCGDLVVEFIHRLKDGQSNNPDKIFGITWKTADINGARTRLQRAGIDVSELREGRKPGTQVFTVRTGTFGVPTLLLQQTARETG
ncbi:MAG TPA: VOC family protein [Afipia sp.]